MEHVLNPQLPVVRNGWIGNSRTGKRFDEYEGKIETGLRKVVRYMMESNPQRVEKQRDVFIPATARGDIHQPGNWICWFGHACFLVQLDGLRILIDPVWHRLGFLRRRVESPFGAEQIGHLDYVLISHDHRDHCDERTIRELSLKLDFTVLTSLEMTGLVKPWLKRGQNIIEAGWYQQYVLPKGAPKISFMPTQHWCRRFLTDMNHRLWGSFMLEGATKSIWFGGDSAYSPHFKEIGAYFPNIDLALIGIGAYKPAWFMKEAHTSPEQAWQGFEESGAKRLLPMHYGTYDLSHEPAGEPLRLISACAKTADRTEDLVMPNIGEVVMV